MGSGRVISDRLDRLEAIEGWCRRMVLSLVGLLLPVARSSRSWCGAVDRRTA